MLNKQDEPFDLIISDLPDPNHEGLTKLYSVQFYNLLASRLNPQGILSVQSTSPFSPGMHSGVFINPLMHPNSRLGLHTHMSPRLEIGDS